VKKFLWIIILYCFNIIINAQPLVNMKITISDDVSASKDLFWGLDPTATDGIDIQLGEEVLPPLPPSGIFDARFIINDYDASWKDYKNGDLKFQGEKTYELSYQPGLGTTIIISWNLPAGITGRLNDKVTGNIIDVSMSGEGKYVVTNPESLKRIKMTINYDLRDTDVNESKIDNRFNLFQNYPNPFNPTTKIKFSLPNKERVIMEVYNVSGKKVEVLLDKELENGDHEVEWKATRYASGMYIYKIIAGNFIDVKKLILMK
jgi:hypothetical protein